MFAELMGKDQGTNRGRGGSMHIADPKLGIFGANGIVAAGLPIAVGAATAAQLRGDGSVAVAFFGDGAVGPGRLPRSAEPGRGVAAARRSSSARTTATPSSRRPPPSTRRRSSSGPPATASPMSPSTAMTWWRPRRRWRTWSSPPGPDGSGRRRGGHLPLARPLRRRPAALPVSRRKSTAGRSATRSSPTRPGCATPVSETTRSRRSSRRWRRAR